MGSKARASKRICRQLFAGAIVALLLGVPLMTGCNNQVLAKAFVQIMPGNTTIGTGLVFPMYAEASPTGVTWAITGGSNCTGTACGALTGATPTSVNYVAPVSIPGSSMSVTITATSTTDSTIKGSETLTVFPEYVQVSGPTNVVPLTDGQFSATVVADPTGDGVTWSLSGSCSSTPQGCGSFSGKPTTTQATFVAPPAAQQETIYVTATSVADPAESQSFAVTVPKLAVFVYTPTTLPTAIAGTPYSATINVWGNTPPYTLTLANPASLPAWATLTQNGNTFTISGTPPAGSLGTAFPTVNVSDSSSPALSGGQAFALTTYPAAPTGNGLLQGSYAFYGAGWADGTKNATTVDDISYIGSFTADGNGNITGGEMDINGPTGIISYTALTGTYNAQYGSMGATQTALITLIPVVQPPAHPPLPITLAVSLGSINSQTNIAAAGHFVEFDDSTGIGGTQGPNSSVFRVQGSLALQSSSVLSSGTSPLSGNWAFGLGGNTDYNEMLSGSGLSYTCLGSSKTCGPISVAGSMAITSTGNINSGLEDVQVNLNTSTSVTLSGTVSNQGNTDPAGRVTASIATSATTSMLTWPSDFVIYAISPQSFYMMSMDSAVTNSHIIGTAMQQNLADIASAPFSASEPLVLYGNIVSSTDLSTSGPNGQIKGLVQILTPVTTSATAGSLAGSQWQNASGTYTSTSTPGSVGSFTYTVDPVSGRVAVSASGQPTLYLVDTNTGYGTMRTTSASSTNPPGLFQFQPQTATSLNAGAFTYSGLYTWSQMAPFETGILEVPTGGVPNSGAVVTLNTGQDFSVFASNGNAYQSSSGETMLYNGPVTGTLSQVSGLFSKGDGKGDGIGIILPGAMQGCGQQAPQGGGWVISATSFVCVPGGGSFGVVHLFQQ